MPKRVKDAYKSPRAPRTSFKEYQPDPGPAGIFSPLVYNLERIVAFAIDRISRLTHSVRIENEEPLRVVVENQIDPKMEVVITSPDFTQITQDSAKLFQESVDASTQKLLSVLKEVKDVKAPVIDAPTIEVSVPKIEPLTVKVSGIDEMERVLNSFQERLELALVQNIQVELASRPIDAPRNYVSGEVKKRDKYGNPTEIVEIYSDGSTSKHTYSWKD